MKQIRVLIIDDEPDIVHLIEFALLRAGFQVESAQTAGDGMFHLSESRFDLIILDVGLPDKNGFDVLKDIRQHNEIPVIMLTAQHEEVDRIIGLELGADDYLGKPFSPRELVARIKAILKRSTAKIVSIKTNADYYYDENRQEIYFRHHYISLTATELRIFVAMLKHPQQVFSREQLLKTAFSDHHPSNLRAVDTHIKTLRQKLREYDENECIRTHRSLGYSYQP